MKDLSKLQKGILMTLLAMTVLFAVLTGVLVFGEPMNVLTAAGILCVLAGVYVLR